MKKMMVAVAVIACAICANAATYVWKTGTSQQVYLMNGSDRAANMVAYLFDSTVTTQADVLNAVFGGQTLSSLAKIDNSTTANTGALANKSTEPVTAGNTLSAFFAIMTTIDDQNYVYISDIASAVGPTTGNGQLTYSAKASSQAAATEWATGGTASAGWYTQSVPEPTSGLLLLLGMAGLALKRKQA